MNWLEIDKVTIFKGKDENGNRYLSQFLRDYQETFNPDMINAGCDRCLEDYYQKMIKNLSIMSKKTTSAYKLKAKYEGIPLAFGSRTQVYNNNLTNEVAEQLLKNHPKGKELFEVIAAKAPAPEKTRSQELNALKRTELDELATSLELNPTDYSTKELIAEAIEAKEVANIEVDSKTETGKSE